MMKSSKKLLIFTVILLIINVFIYLTKLGGNSVVIYFSDGFPVICSLIASWCLWKTVKEFKQLDFTKTVWLFMLIGLVLYFIAESTYSFLELVMKTDMNETYPSVADFFWCIGYIPIIIGLIKMFNGYKKSGFPMGNKNKHIIVSVCLFALFLTVIGIILIPIIKDDETSAFSKIFYLFYPIADTFIVIPAVILFFITNLFGKGSFSKPWKFMAVGFICITFSDLIYSYLNWRDLYGDTNLIDLGWNLGYLSIGIAALYQKELIHSVNELNK